MDETGISSLPVFTCFNCDREFKLRVMLHAHQKECCSKLNTYMNSDHEYIACSKKEFFSLFGLKSVNGNSKHLKLNDITTVHYGDIIVIEDDEDEDDGVDDDSELPIVNKSLSKYHKSVTKKEKYDSKSHPNAFPKVQLKNRRQKLLTLDLTSPLGRRVDFRTSFEKKKQICTINSFPSYEIWCPTFLNELEAKQFNDKYITTSKIPSVRKYNFRQKKPYKKLSKFAEELKLKMKTCSVSINRITTEHGSNYTCDSEKDVSKDCMLFSSDDNESVIRKVYSLALDTSDDSVTSINEDKLINLCDPDNDDCYVYEVEPSNNPTTLVKQNEKTPKSPQSFSFLCRICDSIVECSSGSQESMRQHYANTHNIYNVNLVPHILNGKIVWKLVETNNPIIDKFILNDVNEDEKNNKLLNLLPRTMLLPNKNIKFNNSSHLNCQNLSMFTSASYSEPFNRRHYLTSKSLDYKNFSTDIICID